MDPINPQPNIFPEEPKKNWFTKIKNIPSRYLLIGLIFLLDILLITLIFIEGSFELALLFLPLTLPIIGLNSQKQWANIYLWFIIFGLSWFALITVMFLGYNGFGSSFSNKFEVSVIVALPVIMAILNIISWPKKKA